MARVNIQEEVAQEQASAAVAPPKDLVTDSRGRTIQARKVGPLERLRLFKAIGPQNSKNEQYLGYAMLAASCSAIDGDPVHFPTSELQVEAIVTRLGDEGMEAMSQLQLLVLGVTDEDMAATGGDAGAAVQRAMARKQAETVAAAKN